MGLFSQKCHDCGRSVLSPYDLPKRGAWMNEAVTISPRGEIHVGRYDGYGSVDGAEYAIGNGNTVYHKACWDVLGRPMDYQGESPHAEDQGFFYKTSDYVTPDPRR